MTFFHSTAARLALICVSASTLRAEGPATAPVIQPPVIQPLEPVVPFIAKPLPPGAVKLTGGPLKHAQDLDAKYLLELEPDRMLAHLRTRAGLKAKAPGYGGWDDDGRQLTGHIAGHYLSAVSYMYAATGDQRFKDRADYLVAQLQEIQAKQGDGYIGGLMGNGPKKQNASDDAEQFVDGKILFAQLAEGQIRSGGFDLNGMWSPWYVQHKLYAGLRDAYRLTGNRAALDVEIKFAAWCQSVVGKLNEQQTQKMLDTEFGAMNEVFVDLYADTGDKQWLTLADQFDHHAINRPLAEGRDILAGKHGNTQVPKLLGTLVRYLYTGDEADGRAARNFWDYVVDHHSFASGGHGYDEYFGPADKLSGQVDGTGQRSKSLRTAESCNVYNLLKYTRLLFALRPDVRYADFQERALYNHVLASIDPRDGRTCYMVPVGPGVRHEYQRMFEDFTCCVGSGMESHALHADGLYYATAEKLYVGVYAPATVEWAAAGAKLTMATEFPTGDDATLTVTALDAPKDLTLSFRRPAWAAEGFKLVINGTPWPDLGTPGSFVDVKRTWRAGDTVAIALPKTLRTEPLPDDPTRVAILYGPLVLAGDFGPENDRAKPGRATFPVFAHAGEPLTQWLKPVEGKRGTFTAALADGTTVTLSPFYALHQRRYGLYWDLLTPDAWAKRQLEDAQQANARQATAKATVGYFQPGEMQPERDFAFEADPQSKPARDDDDQPGREGGKWWSLTIPVDPDEANAVILTARMPGDVSVRFTVTYNDQPLVAKTAPSEESIGLTDVAFRIPKELTRDTKRGNLKLTATGEYVLPPIFGLRVVRADDVPALPK